MIIPLLSLVVDYYVNFDNMKFVDFSFK